MNRKKWVRSKRAGSSLALVLCTVVILLLMGGGLLSLGLQGRLRAIRAGADITARTAADAALTRVVFEMNQRLKAGIWDSNSLPQTIDAALLNCDATFDYEVTGDPNGGYVVQCIGKSGWAQKRVRATVKVRGVWDYGILTSEHITLTSGTIVDGYDSSDPNNTAVPVQIATASSGEGTIELGGATVDGEVLIGVDAYFPTVTPPALPDMNAIVVETGTLTIGSADSGEYSSVWVKQGTTLTFDGGGEVVLYVTGNIDIGQDAELIIQPGTSLVIYLDGDLYARNSAGINNLTGDATSFILYGTGEEQTFDLKAKSEWYGAVYAPNADVTLRSDADMYGSFISANFRTTGGGSHIYYDAALQDVGETDVAVYFAVDRWQEG